MNQKLINLTFGISLAVLFLLSVFTFSRLSAFKSYTQVVDNSNQVLNSIVSMRSGFRSLMATQRSYLLTKEEHYYDDFKVERDSLRHTVALFRKQTKDSKIQQVLIDNLEKNINERIQSLLVEVINDTSTARYKFKQADLIKRNNDINEDFNDVLNKMHTYEMSQIKQKLKDKKFEEQFTPFLLLITSLLAISIISYSFFYISKDLRQREEIQRILEENILNLNRSNAELEQYAYVASHDLQEPLRKIRIFSDLLQKKHVNLLDDEGKGLIQKIEKSSERMTLLIKDLLSLSRLLSEKTALVPTSLNDVLGDVLTDMEDKIIENKAEIDSVPLPIVMGNAGQIYQLFQNLISNSLKFGRVGVLTKIKVRVSTISKWEGEQENKFYQVAIIDNGVGFNNEYVEKMFAIFGRIDKTKAIDGTGIGLSIVKRIMQNHNGFVTAEGVPEVSAQFNLFFPVLEND